MDRFVWFVLLVVMSHLVTEFTRVTGYARGNRHDVVLVNDTSLRPMPVASMILYPSEEYQLYDQQQISQYSSIYPNKYNSQNNYNNYNGNPNKQPNSPVMTGTTSNSESAATGFTFSFRPIIDSIFEIPISTLRAVNNLVARLTGSYQHQVPSMTPGVLKSTNDNENLDALQALRSLPTGATSMQTSQPANVAKTTQNDDDKQSDNNNQGNKPIVRVRRTLLREVNA